MNLSESTAVLNPAGTHIHIRFPHNERKLAAVKCMINWAWTNGGAPQERYYTVPLVRDNVEILLRTADITIDPRIHKWYAQQIRSEEPTTDPLTHIDNIPGLRGELLPFQKEGVAMIQAYRGRALLGDEMGLGKTVQALAWLQLRKALRPALIVCPANLKITWLRHVGGWLGGGGKRTAILSGNTPDPAEITGMDIIIINYEILKAWLKVLRGVPLKALLIDEAHYIKNRKAHRTQAALSLSSGIPHVVGITGTPIENRPIEIFSILQVVNPTIFPDYFKFGTKYCTHTEPGHRSWGQMDFTGASHTEELHKILVNTVMIRRLKKDVLKQLPPKRRAVVCLPLDNQTDYNRAEADIITWLTRSKGAEAAEKAANAESLVRIEQLKQLAIAGKMKGVIEWVEDFLEQEPKLIMFCTHKSTVTALRSHFGIRSVDTAAGDRQEAVDRFQRDPSVELFIGSIKRDGVGHTLTAASNVAFCELEWPPGKHDQAEDRAHRIGQEAESITCWYLIGQGTVEEDIVTIQDEKRKVLASVLDGAEVPESDMVSALLKRLMARGGQ